MDTLLAKFLPLWMEVGYTIVITADHGMNRDGMHGGTGNDERLVPLYAIGDPVIPGIYEAMIPQLAVAPLICQLLGIEPSDEMISYEWPFLQR